MQRLSHILFFLILFLSFYITGNSAHCLAFSNVPLPVIDQIPNSDICFLSKKNSNHEIYSETAAKTAIKISKKHYSEFIKNIGKHDAAVIATMNGTPLLAKNDQTLLIPASTLKILTALVALHYLGPDYRFVTDFYLDADQNLKIKGYGDPLLISESLKQIASVLSQKINIINDIIIDDTYFQTPLMIPGKNKSQQPYDAPNGALCVNFNTVAFKTIKGQYVSAEPQTPLLPFALTRVRLSGIKKGRIMLAGGQQESVQYAGELFQYFLSQAGIKMKGTIKKGRIRKDVDRLILHHFSQFNLAQIITRLMEFSNNFIANQLFLTAGIAAQGPPGTLLKGIQTSKKYINTYLETKNIQIVEGSGLSRSNRMSAKAMIALLKQFEPFYQLLKKNGKEYYKTGTLSNVRSRAGYLEDSNGQHYPFIVFINTPGKTTKATMQLFRKIVNHHQ